MSSNESLVLSTQHVPVVRLHATALFGILNSHARREDRNSRVIGTLLGVQTEGFTDVSDSFGVPHLEKSDELCVAINKDYHKGMCNFHRRIQRKESIVGWYATALPSGALVTDNSSLIHDFYAGECSSLIHLVVDTSLSAGASSMNIKAYVSQPMVVGESAVANMFQEIKVEISLTESEKICLYHMTHHEPLQEGSPSTHLVSSVPSQPTNVVTSLELLVTLLDKISQYVDEVVAGTRAADPSVGMLLADVLGSLRVVDPADFQAFFADKMQDMLMVSYVSSLTTTQLAVAERLICLL